MTETMAPTDEERRFRVEHRGGDGPRLLGHLTDVPAHHATLAPYANRLWREGARGEVVLIDEATGTVVARRRVTGGKRPRRLPPAPWSPYRRERAAPAEGSRDAEKADGWPS